MWRLESELARATVRRRLEHLESVLGQSLLERQGEAIELTPAGQYLQRDGAQLVALSTRLKTRLRDQARDAVVDGNLTIAIQSLPEPQIARTALELLKTNYPRLNLSVRCVAEPINELEHDCDLAIALGARPPEPWISRSVALLRDQCFAHESYLREAGEPQSVEELSRHRIVSLHTNARSAERWPLFPDRIGAQIRLWVASAPVARWSPLMRAFSDVIARTVATLTQGTDMHALDDEGEPFSAPEG